ncbi:carbohydrate ABC transporter permease [Pedococcus sp. 5OH_020]|uniref:carbohydrate ABC transporter permease n=1 Tax=Pedococcus sp. 5OH_020 TaxID=2989814 RepID=UPI0022E9D6AD|nr:sugar ABC transporter permease [Pedococcus sp. 5OH_020]
MQDVVRVRRHPTARRQDTGKPSHWRKNAMAYSLILPSLVFLFAIVFYPLATGLAEGFRYHSRVQPWLTRFNGLDNYVQALHDHDVWLALRTSLIMTVGIVGLSYLLGLVSGLLLNHKFRMRGLYRALILVPWVVPPVVSYISWQWMLNDQSGLIDVLLVKLHLVDSPVLFLSNPRLAMASIIVVGVWSRFPFMMITVLAALSSIPDDLNESAALDGANRWQTFRYITMPLILPVTVVATLLQAIWTFNDFGLPFVLTGGGPANSTTPLILLAYKEAFQRFNIGYGTSLAIISMVLMLLLGAIYLRLQKKQGVYQ